MNKKHPLIKATEDFLKAIKAVEKDECINLNIGYHDHQIEKTFSAFIKEVYDIPLLVSVLDKFYDKDQLKGE